MKLVKDLLDEKGHDVWTVGPDHSVFDALEAMTARNVGALLVLNGSELVGVISERDYARRIALEGRTSRGTPVREIMTEVVATVGPGTTVDECMELMTNKRVRHLPVVDEDTLVGVISIGDVVKSLIAHQEFKIKQLENYITGRV